jgi:hypothetical protein
MQRRWRRRWCDGGGGGGGGGGDVHHHHRLHCALPGWDAAAERSEAHDEFNGAAQARARPDGNFDADRDLGLDVAARAVGGGRWACGCGGRLGPGACTALCVCIAYRARNRVQFAQKKEHLAHTSALGVLGQNKSA